MSSPVLTHLHLRALASASSKGPARSTGVARGLASGRTAFPAEALKVRRRAPSSRRTRSRRTFVETEIELTNACPSGRAPVTTPASRDALHPPGQGLWVPAHRYRSSAEAVDREDVAGCSLQPFPVFNEHPEVRPNLVSSLRARFPGRTLEARIGDFAPFLPAALAGQS
jgi:hypothetical protein